MRVIRGSGVQAMMMCTYYTKLCEPEDLVGSCLHNSFLHTHECQP